MCNLFSDSLINWYAGNILHGLIKNQTLLIISPSLCSFFSPSVTQSLFYWPTSVRTGLLSFHSSEICLFSKSRLCGGSATPPRSLWASVTCCSTVSPRLSSAPFRSSCLRRRRTAMNIIAAGFIRSERGRRPVIASIYNAHTAYELTEVNK